MVDKRSLRSSKNKDSKNDPADDPELPKPSRSRSGKTRKGAGANTDQETSKSMDIDDTRMDIEQDRKETEKGNEIEMKDITSTDIVKDEEDGLKPIEVVRQNLQLLEKAVATSDARFTYRVLRSLSILRKRISSDINTLLQIVREVYPPEHESVSVILSLFGKEATSMEVDPPVSTKAKDQFRKITPEGDAYINLITQLALLDSGKLKEGAEYSSTLVQRIHTLNRRTLDQLAAKIYFYYSRFYELIGELASIRPFLLTALRTATIRHDTDTHATLLTLLLRSYLQDKLYDAADKLVSKTTFPEAASNNTQARHLYYVGRIRAIQLDYSAAHQNLLMAIRKAPQQNMKAVGFLQTVHKFFLVVELLMGDIPEKSTFRLPILEKALAPYAQIVQAVRVGDLGNFNTAITVNAAIFRRDDTYTLILRLRQNVIKTGLRMISLSYSRIGLKDVCMKLGLDSEESAEYIVAKAIRDGVIEASINHSGGFMQSAEVGDVYGTEEPLAAFHERIKFCLNLHNDSVRAMRFPMKDAGTEGEVDKLREMEAELAKVIEDGDLDDDDDVGPDFGM